MFKVALGMVRGYLPLAARAAPLAALTVALLALIVGFWARAGASDTGADLTAVSSELALTRGDLSVAAAQVAALEKELAAARSDRTAAESALQTTLDGVVLGHATLSGAVTVLQTGQAGHANELDDLGTDYAVIDRSLAAASADLTSARDDLKVLTGQFGDLKNSYLLSRDAIAANGATALANAQTSTANKAAIDLNEQGIATLQSAQKTTDQVIAVLQEDIGAALGKIAAAMKYAAAVEAYFEWKGATAQVLGQPGSTEILGSSLDVMAAAAGLTANVPLQSAYRDWRNAIILEDSVRKEAYFLSQLGERLMEALAPV